MVVAKKEAAASVKNEKKAAEEAAAVSPPLSQDEERLIALSKRAYGALISTLGSVQLRLCQHVVLGDAHGIWKVLLDNYERKSVATKVRLMEELFGIMLSRGESVGLYVARLTELQRKLADQDESISDSVLLFVLLRGVSRLYSTLVTLLKMNEKLTFEQAVEAIKNEEERKKMERAAGEETIYSAAISEKGGEDRRCHHCNEVGHLKFKCPKLKCHRCKRTGHMASKCRAVHPAASSKKRQDSSSSEEEDTGMMMMRRELEGESSDWGYDE